MGRGFLIVSSTKQNLNKKISTETEIMDVDYFMLEICWTRYIIAVKGYNVKAYRLHQENKSYILMKNNRKALNRKWTKHINIWYLFIKYIVNKGEVSVVWCPTGDMIGYHMTKPLQGDIFRKFRDKIMGVILAADPGPGKFKVVQLRKI